MKTKTYLFSTSSHPQAININSLKIELFKPDINFDNYDYFIISSKQAVHALRQYSKDEYIDKQTIAISTKSAESYRELGGEVLEVGDGYGSDLSNIIKKYPKSTRWLYLRAETIASDFAEQCRESGYNINESIVYKSECSDDCSNIKIEENASLIFTSPSTVKCYLKTHKLTQKNFIVVIGETTAKALPAGLKYKISQDKSIESCIEMIKRNS